MIFLDWDGIKSFVRNNASPLPPGKLALVPTLVTLLSATQEQLSPWTHPVTNSALPEGMSASFTPTLSWVHRTLWPLAHHIKKELYLPANTALTYWTHGIDTPGRESLLKYKLWYKYSKSLWKDSPSSFYNGSKGTPVVPASASTWASILRPQLCPDSVSTHEWPHLSPQLKQSWVHSYCFAS